MGLDFARAFGQPNVLIPSVLAVLAVCVPTWPATYYVATDGNDAHNGRFPSARGGNDGPWRTVRKAAATLSAGDTVLIRAGKYYEGPSILIRRSGTAEEPIVFKAY